MFDRRETETETETVEEAVALTSRWVEWNRTTRLSRAGRRGQGSECEKATTTTTTTTTTTKKKMMKKESRAQTRTGW